ncbi:uncharacterized protein TRIADDRAFT_28074 [Trichoplax adhaerens]|uniref:Acyl-coenzyme A oxidase n=1 Tax=Trichoplax adhaerens TaxID=10228 RepID=B3S2A7_TRIAD|nr:hypothetical protein TRIADDRAFT_28074 [Trichoplax adhaerens]EDV23614.1 hypothetical protein TRIADDRAFT_28074 [Trichoplax adhaerens]|eukprot:XP_002114524.1 hypothetical protein TRIADDRAFT_28074 [Trichoplax adhaerens]
MASPSSDLDRERRKCTFNVAELTDIINGGREKTERRQYLESLVLNEPIFNYDDYYFLSREEKYSDAVKKTVRLVQVLKQHNIEDPEDYQTLLKYVLNLNLPIALHNSMFRPTIRDQGTDEQRKKWLPLANDYKIIGTYAQTELGHGTFIRGLETTSTYDPKREEFVLNTPTLTATKWWPGCLGKTSTHAVVMAQLYIKNQCYGIHSFIIQLRSLKDHSPMPGVTVGDIGNKVGLETNDNGFLAMDNVRIPRENMLMRHAQVYPDGTYRKPANSKLVYGTMVLLRATVVSESATNLSKAATIAIRYSCVRRQTEAKPGELEPQIIDYVTQQHKLVPQLATAYAFAWIARYMMSTYHALHADIESGHLGALQELHGISSGLKAFTAEMSVSGIEVCRRACGGHGFSAASGLVSMYKDRLPSCTYEGENTVLYLQTARFLLKCFRQPSITPSSMSYIQVKPLPGARWGVKSPEDLMKPILLVEAFEHRAQRTIKSAAQFLESQISQGLDTSEAMNRSGIEFVRCAKAHCYYFVTRNFFQSTALLKCSKEIKESLLTLGVVFALNGIADNSGEFLEDCFITGTQMEFVRERILYCYKQLRPNLVGLVDAFAFADQSLNSALGAYDGDVYNRLYNWAKRAPLNKTDVHSSYHKYLKPILKSKI